MVDSLKVSEIDLSLDFLKGSLIEVNYRVRQTYGDFEFMVAVVNGLLPFIQINPWVNLKLIHFSI
jgi:hypothetical protein